MEMLKNGKQANQSNTDMPQIGSPVTGLKPWIGRAFFGQWCSPKGHLHSRFPSPLLWQREQGSGSGLGCWQTDRQTARFLRPCSGNSPVPREGHAEGWKERLADDCLPTQDSPAGEKLPLSWKPLLHSQWNHPGRLTQREWLWHAMIPSAHSSISASEKNTSQPGN